MTTTWHLQDSPSEGWVTIATAPTIDYPDEMALLRYALRIRENVRSQRGRTYEGGHRIIRVTTETTWTAKADDILTDLGMDDPNDWITT